MNRQSWHQREDQAIKNLVEEYGCDDWSKISSQLASKYTFNRTGKQCRERWYNHLDPKVCKKAWTDHQQRFLFEKHKQIGNHWKQISKHLEGRTDNDVKNHFYSTLRRSLRRLNKGMGKKNSTSQMRQIKPSVLSTMMKIIYSEQNDQNITPQNEFNALKALPLMIFEYSNYKPLKAQELTSELKEKYMQILEILNKFKQDIEQQNSSDYQKDKSQYKKKAAGKKQLKDESKKKTKKNFQTSSNKQLNKNSIHKSQQQQSDQSLKRSQSLKQQTILETLIHQEEYTIKENLLNHIYQDLHIKNNEENIPMDKQRRISLEEDQFQIQEHYHHYQDDGSEMENQHNQQEIVQATVQGQKYNSFNYQIVQNNKFCLKQEHKVFQYQLTQNLKELMIKEDFLNQVLQLS